MATYILKQNRYKARMVDGRKRQDAIRKWLRAALAQQNMSQSELARQLSTRLQTNFGRDFVNKILLHNRNVSVDELEAMVSILKLDPPVFADRKTVPLVGYVEAGAQLFLFGKGHGLFDEVDAPPDATSSTVAVEVRGDSMYGIADDGYVLFYEDRRECVTDDMLGKLCIIGLPNDVVVVKKVMRGSRDGTFTLISTNAPPMADVQVEWAARVTWIKPG